MKEPAGLPQAHAIGGAHIIWLGGGSCEGCTMAALGASEPGIEDLLAGRIPEVPPIELLHPVLHLDSGDAYRAHLERAERGELDPFLLVLEGSILDETLAGAGSFSRLGSDGDQPVTISRWIDRLAPMAAAVVAIGSCAAWGGIPAAAGSPTGAMGLADYLDPNFRCRSGLPIINVPGCAPSGEAFIETLVYIFLHLQRLVPLELDEERRPRWVYTELVTPSPPRADYLPLSAYSAAGRPKVGCPVPSRGWMNRLGGCASVGGACIGCTDRDFIDRHLEFVRPDQFR